MKDRIKKLIYNINYPLLKNIILMESNPDFSDNPRAVFDEMIKRGLNNKYKIVWIVTKKDTVKDIKIHNTKFVSRNKKGIEKIIYLYYRMFAKNIIDCNNYLFKMNKNQYRIYLQHGQPFKNAREYCSGIGAVDYINQTSDFFTDAHADLFGVPIEKILTLGFPRNDWLYHKMDKEIFGIKGKYNKIIVWFPTYRNHNRKNENNSTFKYGVPVINSYEGLLKINTVLKSKNILLLMKMHPAEDIKKIESIELSNIQIIDDDLFVSKHLALYNMLPISDAFITDYSSIYYDYLLTKKPIGLAIPDLAEYVKHTGLYYGDYKKILKGDYIYNIDELIEFINNVANGIDKSYDERMKALKLYHKYFDGESSKRVVDFIIKKISVRR